MRDWWDEWYNKYAVFVLVMALGYGVYQSFCWSKLTPSDWAAWTGAVFTGLAFVGTIFLATRTERDRKKARWDLAVVSAAGVLERAILGRHALKQIDISIQQALEEISLQPDPEAYAREHFESFAGRLHAAFCGCPTFEREELAAMLALPNRCAAHLAASSQRIQTMKIDIDVVQKSGLQVECSPIFFLGKYRENLAGCFVSFGIAIGECKNVLADVNNDLNFHYESGTDFGS